MNGDLYGAAVTAECAHPGGSPKQQPLRRRRHHAEHRLVVAHQRDIDGELAVALHELARAVEGIDHP
jgi:hypothetical protein